MKQFERHLSTRQKSTNVTKASEKGVKAMSNARGNFLCNLQHNAVAFQVARKISLCDTSCLQLVSQEKLRCKLYRESRSSFYFSQCYATSCSVVTPPLQLVSQFSKKEPITIRHGQNAADIFKYSAVVKYNLTAGRKTMRKTSCVGLTS